MKVKTVVLSCLIGAVVLFFVHEFSLDQPIAPAAASKIGLISVSRAMSDCKATATFGAKAKAEYAQMTDAEDALTGEIKMQTRTVQDLVRGTADYNAQFKLLLQKQGELKALQEYGRDYRDSSRQRWAEKVYREVLRITKANIDLLGFTHFYIK